MKILYDRAYSQYVKAVIGCGQDAITTHTPDPAQAVTYATQEDAETIAAKLGEGYEAIDRDEAIHFEKELQSAFRQAELIQKALERP